MKHQTIAIVGAGNMGTSLIGGLIATGCNPKNIWVSDVDQEKLKKLEQIFKIHTTPENHIAIEAASVIILAVKPQHMESITVQIGKALKPEKQLLISVAAGITLAKIQAWANTNCAIIRCMPNTPALIRCGAAALFGNANVTKEHREIAESIFRAVGLVVWLQEEKQMDAVTALSGSGPAYFFLFMEALQQTGVNMGLSPEISKVLTMQTALGAARMALESKDGVEELRKKVTSKGGTTEAAIKSFEQNNFQELVETALKAAQNRSEELSQETT